MTSLLSFLILGVHLIGVPPGFFNATIKGTVTDAESGEPVPFSYVHLEEINRTAVADIEGYYELKNVPDGSYILTVHRIGYRTQTREVSLDSTDINIDIKLKPTVLGTQSVEVVGQKEDLRGSGLEHASKKFFGSDLRRNLGSTLSSTLSNLPGFDQRSMGSAPGRPVIRGMGGERVLILQDGLRSGDVSSQSSDHAVSIDPISAQEVEIARGPAALAYGANAIGGVINVVRNQIETSVPNRVNGNFTLSGESVNNGLAGALDITAPIADFALSLELNGRTATNAQTPEGELQNSYYNTTNDAIGLSWIRDWGYVGAAFSTYLNNYGIPPDPVGHPNGVDIEMKKFQYDVQSEVIFDKAYLNVLETDFSFKNYTHKEIESSGALGTQFGLLTTNISANASHEKIGIFDRGSYGIWAEIEDYAVIGASTPDANSYKLAAYLIEEININNFHLEAGLRYEWVQNKPVEDDPTSSIGFIRERTFSALSSSFSGIYNFGNGFSSGFTFLHSFRAPSLEELYSEGPHLASYSFEIGNPELEEERALAKELFVRYQVSKANVQAGVFHNDFSNYLYARNTGERNNRRPDLNNYQFVGTNALLYGFEFSGEIQLAQTWVLDGSVSYTYAQRDVSQQEQQVTGYPESTRPLPQIPPLKGNISLKYTNGLIEIGSRFRFADRQDRLGEFETPTPAYEILDLFGQLRISRGKLLHTLALNVNNILNETYYNHLSRIKDIRPEPGRNFSLLYRVYF